ncbi:MAG TPA: hypothetical protein VK403_07145 [Allosphingosinicella sp.]|nr:hypothetical protein [Allosphingosinicella sp.]
MEDGYDFPPVRRLRVYAFDPQASMQIDTAGINVATIELPWEQRFEPALEPGPVNEYLEVIDVDPVSGQFYEPVDLNHPFVLAQDGLAPSEGDPRFHQQMVFAVAMKTINAFERALGRRVLWTPRWTGKKYEQVPRLRVYPHALREPNAYYSKDKVALLFGYFRASTREAGANWVFTALSHDVVVHETTHAILDGLHRRYSEPTSIDSLAFHEAFADIVALLSHFTLTEAVRREISAHGGRLDQRTLMTGLARQFGVATGRKGALREAVDSKLDGNTPDHTQIESLTEPHARGAVLVAAIFEAFLTIFQTRSADLLRLADVSVDRRVHRDLHPDLVNRLAREASKSADHVLRMCLRALDYLPPVDVRFGEFLRAIVTADHDLVPFDRLGYRLAVVEAFRRRGIVPEGCLSLAPDSLLWERPERELTLKHLPPLRLDPARDRAEAAEHAEFNRFKVHQWLVEAMDRGGVGPDWEDASGVIFPSKDCEVPRTISHWPDREPRVKIEVHSVRTTRRTGPDGQDQRQLIVEIAQRRRGFYDPEEQEREEKASGDPLAENFVFRGGATLIFDLRERKLRYTIRKRINDADRLEAQRLFLQGGEAGALAATYGERQRAREPFAMMHRGEI